MFHKRPFSGVGFVGQPAKTINYTDKTTGEIKDFVVFPVCCGYKQSKQWFHVKVFGKKAEKAAKLFTGDLVYISGLYEPEAYKDKGGKPALMHAVLVSGGADTFIMPLVGSRFDDDAEAHRQGEEAPAPTKTTPHPQAESAAPAPTYDGGDYDGEVLGLYEPPAFDPDEAGDYADLGDLNAERGGR